MVLRARVSPAAGILAVCLIALPLAWSTNAAQQAAPPSASTSHQALLDRYCLTCHTQRLKERGTVPIALDNLDITQVGANPAVWEKVVLKMRAGLMPPAGAPRPDKVTHDAFAKVSSIAMRPHIPIQVAPSPSTD
jgi:mono/diheme cytochrome c family protein